MGLQTKHTSIIYIYNAITKLAGEHYFEPPDFWEGDLCAIGLHKNDKLVYISTYIYLEDFNNNPRFFAEFEIIDPTTFMTLKKLQTIESARESELLTEIKTFFGL